MSNNNPYQSYPWEYDKWYDQNLPAYQSELDCLRGFLPITGVGLEIGVGTGRFAGPLGIEWGIDPAREMLVRGRPRGVRGIQGRGEFLPFDSGSFDYVIMVTVLCFLACPERVVGEVHRVLKDEGRLIIGFVDRESHLGKKYQEKKEDSRFYREARFSSVPDIFQLLSSAAWRDILVRQTLLVAPEEMTSVQSSSEGWGEGGFVVVSAGKGE